MWLFNLEKNLKQNPQLLRMLKLKIRDLEFSQLHLTSSTNLFQSLSDQTLPTSEINEEQPETDDIFYYFTYQDKK